MSDIIKDLESLLPQDKGDEYDKYLEELRQIIRKKIKEMRNCNICEWTKLQKKLLFPYKTSCGNEDLYDNSYKYCPYCGKEIKIILK